MTVEQEIDIFMQYGEADMSKRLHLFLQFPDLRGGFQEIERKYLALRTFNKVKGGATKDKILASEIRG